MKRISYIDASPLMAEMMERAWPDCAQEMDVHIGDMPAEAIPVRAAGAEVILNGHTMMDAALLDRLTNLRRIIFLGSGPRSYIDVDAAEARGITVDRITGYGDRAVAEHALALIFAAARQVTRMDRELRGGTWAPQEGLELQSRRLGLIGFGGIGRSLAEMARGLGMEVVIWNRSPLPQDWAAHSVGLEDLLKNSDIVSMHLALTAQTGQFLGAAEIAQMKRGAVFINTARAGLVDTAALIAALKEGRLSHAALDVFDHEPLPAGAPIFSAPNVTLTAHAGFKTREATERLAKAAADMLRG